MKVDIKNTDLLNDKFKLSRKKKNGTITACLVAGLGALYGYTFLDSDTTNHKIIETSANDFVDVEPISIALDDVNQLKIIINDYDCSNTLFQDVCEQLNYDGVSFTPTQKGIGVNVEKGVVFTLDQQYVSGPNTLILAPQENSRSGNSDILSLATNAAFYEKGFFTREISCGKVGYRETEDGEVLERIPTETEEMIEKDSDTSFVTISFGTQNVNAELVASGIENALARYVSYISNGSNKERDFIYRVEPKDTLDSVAKHYDSTISEINSSNNRHYDDMQISTDQTIINPKASTVKEFDPHIPVNLYAGKTLWSK